MPEDVLIQEEDTLHDNGAQKDMGLKPEPSSTSLPSDFNPLLAAVKKWGRWVLEEARKELAAFYRSSDPDETIVGYIWARTLPCQNPACGAEIPLIRQFWLARKKDREIALHPVVREGRVDFEVVARGKKAIGAQHAAAETQYAPWPSGFDPKHGTVARAVVTCPVCGGTISANDTRRLFQEGKAGQRMVAEVFTLAGQTGKFYRLPTQADLEAYMAAERALAEKRQRLAQAWGMDPVPDEPLRRVPVVFGVINVWIYGMTTWGDLFNPRQQLALITFAKKVRQAHAAMLAQGYPEDFARAVVTYLSLVFSRHSSYNATLCWWEPLGERS
ncbi:MAG TPA: hypothetical protein G4O05_04090, partial [Caldilineae bacterium]|nr:hypothetical protein [Caldilineae bacterium]